MARANGDKSAGGRRFASVAVRDNVGGDFGCRHILRCGTYGRGGEDRMRGVAELGREGRPGAIPIGAMPVVALHARSPARLNERADADSFLIDDDWQMIEAISRCGREGAARRFAKTQHHRQVGVVRRGCPYARMGEDRFDDACKGAGANIVVQGHLILTPPAYRRCGEAGRATKTRFVTEEWFTGEIPLASVANDSGGNQLGDDGAEVTGKFGNVAGHRRLECIDRTNAVKQSKDLDESGLVPDDETGCGPDLQMISVAAQ